MADGCIQKKSSKSNIPRISKVNPKTYKKFDKDNKAITCTSEEEEGQLRPRSKFDFSLLADQCNENKSCKSKIPKFIKVLKASETVGETSSQALQNKPTQKNKCSIPVQKSVSLQKNAIHPYKLGGTKSSKHNQNKFDSSKLPNVSISEGIKNQHHHSDQNTFALIGQDELFVTTCTGLPTNSIPGLSQQNLFEDFIQHDDTDEEVKDDLWNEYTVEYIDNEIDFQHDNNIEFDEDDHLEIQNDVRQDIEEETIRAAAQEFHEIKGKITMADISSFEKLADVLSVLTLKVDTIDKNVVSIKKIINKDKCASTVLNGIKFPLKTIEDLDYFEEKLGNNEEFGNEMVNIY